MAESAAIELFRSVEDYVARAVRPHAEQIAALEAKHASDVADLRAQLAARPDAKALAEMLARSVAEAVSALPRPEPGKDGRDGANGRDGENGLPGMNGKDGAPGERGERGPAGADGKDAEVDYDRIGNVIAVAVEKEVAKFPAPRDGRDGKDGKDGTNGKDGAPGRDADAELIVVRVLERMPKPERGLQGEKGERGESGLQGERGEKGETGQIGAKGDPGERGDRGERGFDGMSAFEIAREHGFVGDAVAWLASLVGKDGADGRAGTDGKDGASVHPDSIKVMVRSAIEEALPAAMAQIPRPADGKSIDPAEVARMVDAEVDKQLTALLPLIRGEKGEPGLGINDLRCEQIKGEGVVRLLIGEREVGRICGLPHERGVYKRGTYHEGAICTFGGSAFIALRDTSDPIGTDPPSPDWRLLVKRGRDAS